MAQRITKLAAYSRGYLKSYYRGGECVGRAGTLTAASGVLRNATGSCLQTE